MGTGSSPWVKSGRGVTLTPHPLLVPWSWKGRAIPLLPLWAVRPVQGLSACTEPQCLYKGALYLYLPLHYFKIYRVFFLLDRSASARRSNEFLLDILKVIIIAIVLSSPRHWLLNVPDTRCTTQDWQSPGWSVGRALIGQARIKHLIHFIFESLSPCI